MVQYTNMKIAMAHFRAGLTDGVSLEIDKRKKLLEEMGHSIVLIAGTHAGDLDLYIPEFEYKKDPVVAEIQKLAFQPEKDAEFKEKVTAAASRIEAQLEEFYKKEQFQVIFIHNVFCLATCIPGTLAFYNFLKNHPELRAITIHHDFYWEPARAAVSAFTAPTAVHIQNEAYAPNLPNLTHTVINSLAQKELKKRKNIDAEIITDTFDFDQPQWVKNDRNRDFLKDNGLTENDLAFLIAVRVRDRKAVELAIDTVAEVTAYKQNIIGKKKYNGAEITPESKVVLLIPGEYTPKEEAYVQKLKERAAKKAVDVRWISDIVGSEEQQALGEIKYALWDCYVYADAVMYTSYWEGWGNQFIEAVFSKTPVVVFEYPVFESDIKSDGFHVVSLGSEYTLDETGLATVPQEKVKQAAEEICTIITNSEQYTKIVEENFKIGKGKYNTNTRLKEHLSQFIQQ